MSEPIRSDALRYWHQEARVLLVQAQVDDCAQELAIEQRRRWQFCQEREVRLLARKVAREPTQLQLLQVAPAPRPLDPERLRAQLIANGFPGVLR